jgi:hypothetical protein
MNDHRRWIVWVAVAAALAANVASAATQANAGLQLDRSPGTHQAHDFSDGFYRQNGLDPKSADFRRRFEDVKGKPFLPFSKKTNTKDPTRSKTRVLPVNCGYDASGQTLCYPGPPVFFGEESFLDNPQGELARELAAFRAFIFPKAAGAPLSPAPPNRRQDNLFETTKGYVGANPLGLWRLTFVSYTAAAFVEPGLTTLAPLHVQNGTDTDGTPVIKRLHVLLNLEAQGLVEFNVRVPGVNPEPWVV